MCVYVHGYTCAVAPCGCERITSDVIHYLPPCLRPGCFYSSLYIGIASYTASESPGLVFHPTLVMLEL